MPLGPKLKSRLESYSVAGKNLANRRWTRWEVYAAAAGSTLALTTGASASIIWSGFQNLVLQISEADRNFNRDVQTAIDIDGDGHNIQFRLDNFRRTDTTTYESSGYTVTRTYTSQQAKASVRFIGGGVVTSGFYAAKFALSSLIGSSGSSANGGTLHSHHETSSGSVNTYGNFARNDSGFVGVKFYRGGSAHYGWVHIRLADSNNNRFVDKLTILGWAYESDPETAIAAGAIPPTPEPGTFSLALLAMGAAGVLALRRGRRAEEPEEGA